MLEVSALITAIVALWGALQVSLKSKEKAVKAEQARADKREEKLEALHKEQQRFIIDHYEGIIKTIKKLAGIQDTEAFNKKVLESTDKREKMSQDELERIRKLLERISLSAPENPSKCDNTNESN